MTRSAASSRRSRCGATASLLSLAVAATLGASAGAQTIPYQSANRDRIGRGPAQSNLPRGGVFEPRLELAANYGANLTLEPDGSPQLDMAGLEAAPGFYASYSSASTVGVIDYSLIGRAWEDSDYNDVSHRLGANGEWTAVQDLLYVSGRASYEDAVVDPALGINYGGLGIFGASNLRERAIAMVSPALRKSVGGLDLLAQYRYGRVWYLDNPDNLPPAQPGFIGYDQDSTDTAVTLSVANSERGSAWSGRIYYDWTRSEYEVSLPFRYEALGVDVGYAFSRDLSFVGDFGVESDLDNSTTQGGLDSEFWHLGLRWEPDNYTNAEARVGRRYFGNSYEFDLRRRARSIELRATYDEVPTVETQQVSLGQFDPGELPPSPPGVDIGGPTASPYLRRDANFYVRAQGSKTSAGLRLFNSDREFVRPRLGFPDEDTTTGVIFDVTRRFSDKSSIDWSSRYSEFRQSIAEIGGAQDLQPSYTTNLSLRYNRKIGRATIASIETGFLNQGGSPAYDGWWAVLRFRYEP